MHVTVILMPLDAEKRVVEKQVGFQITASNFLCLLALLQFPIY